jgi:hypothetical protein
VTRYGRPGIRWSDVTAERRGDRCGFLSSCWCPFHSKVFGHEPALDCPGGDFGSGTNAQLVLDPLDMHLSVVECDLI